jgi:tetratricopeptide (TPR) repeat protein
MPDWTPLCVASLGDDPLARRLTEIEEAESWLDLNPDAAFECCHRAAATDAHSAVRFAEAFTLIREALRHDLVIEDGPEGSAQLTRANEAYQSGTMPPDQRRLWDRYLLAAAMGTHLQSLVPATTSASHFDEEPIRAELLMLSQEQWNAQSGQVIAGPPTIENLAEQEAILIRYRALQSAQTSQSLSSDIAILAAHVAYRLGRSWRQLGELDNAVAFFDEAGSLFDVRRL